MQGRNCVVCLKTVLEMKKNYPYPLQKNLFILIIFLKNFFKEVRLATLFFNRYNMALGLLGEVVLNILM